MSHWVLKYGIPREIQELVEGLPRLTESQINTLGHHGMPVICPVSLLPLMYTVYAIIRFCLSNLFHGSPCTAR
jgi:hypothetical protein